jgi:hypothetical protein
MQDRSTPARRIFLLRTAGPYIGSFATDALGAPLGTMSAVPRKPTSSFSAISVVMGQKATLRLDNTRGGAAPIVEPDRQVSITDIAGGMQNVPRAARRTRGSETSVMHGGTRVLDYRLIKRQELSPRAGMFIKERSWFHI